MARLRGLQCFGSCGARHVPATLDGLCLKCSPRIEGARVEQHAHEIQERGCVVTCDEYERYASDVWSSRNKQIADIAMALGVYGGNTVALVDDLHKSSLAEIERLKARENAWQQAVHEAVNGNGVGKYGDADCAVITGEALCDLRDKARKWDEHEARHIKFTMQCKAEDLVEHTFTPVITYKPRPTESGPGLRDGSGKYTEPGEPIIYCDSGWDD